MPATAAEIEAHEDLIDEFYYKDSLAKQQLFSTILDHVLLQVQSLDNSSMIWKEICRIHEGKSDLVKIDVQWRLSETQCEESGDMRLHFFELRRLHELLAGMGVSIPDDDFTTIIMGSLLESYRPILSPMSAAARIAKTPLTPYDLISFVLEEYEHCQLTVTQTSKKGGNAALSTDSSCRNTPKAKGPTPDVVCYNCNKKGHFKSDCWGPGGGKEGQALKRNSQSRGKSPKQTASVAAVPETQKDFAFASTDAKPVGKRCAIIDSGATSHFCPDRSKFVTFSEIEPQDVCTAGGTCISAIGRGDVKIDLPFSKMKTTVTLKNTLYTLEMAFTLIFTPHMAPAGFALHFESRTCNVLMPLPGRRIIATIPQIDRLYSIAATAKESTPIVLRRYQLAS